MTKKKTHPNCNKGQLIEAQATTLECLIEENGLLVPLFSEPSGPMLYKDVANFETMTIKPLLPDPYESAMVEVKESSVEGANEGLFARKSVEPNTILAFYNGIRKLPKTTFTPPDWVGGAYRIFDPTREKGSLDIPEEYRSLENYCASLAHKTNHSFLPSGEFDEFEHPRHSWLHAPLHKFKLSKLPRSFAKGS